MIYKFILAFVLCLYRPTNYRLYIQPVYCIQYIQYEVYNCMVMRYAQQNDKWIAVQLSTCGVSAMIHRLPSQLIASHSTAPWTSLNYPWFHLKPHDSYLTTIQLECVTSRWFMIDCLIDSFEASGLALLGQIWGLLPVAHVRHNMA